MRRLLIIGLFLVAGCENDSGASARTDGSADAPADLAPLPDAGSETAPAAPSRLERPSDLPRPPNGRLPVDLFPPAQ